MKISSKVKIMLRSLLMKAGSVETEKATLLYDGDELEVGADVFVENADGEVVPAEDGEYVAGDKTYVVADGKLSEIKEKESEEVEISASKQKFSAIKTAFEETYDEKMQKIYSAIAALIGHNDFWVREAADDYAIAEIWNEGEDTYKDYRFAISWDEEGNAIASDQTEVKETFVPVDSVVEDFEEEPKPAEEEGKPEEEQTKGTDERVDDLENAVGEIREGIDNLTNAIAALVKRVEAAEEKLASLEEPAADPAEEGEETEQKFTSRLSYLNKK